MNSPPRQRKPGARVADEEGGSSMHDVRNIALLFVSLLLTGTTALVAYDVYVATQCHRLVGARTRVSRVVARRTGH
jgi:hypothetical protein